VLKRLVGLERVLGVESPAAVGTFVGLEVVVDVDVLAEGHVVAVRPLAEVTCLLTWGQVSVDVGEEAGGGNVFAARLTDHRTVRTGKKPNAKYIKTCPLSTIVV
jgi:hypothetical protein